jgi:hypothetical protein
VRYFFWIMKYMCFACSLENNCTCDGRHLRRKHTYLHLSISSSSPSTWSF